MNFKEWLEGIFCSDCLITNKRLKTENEALKRETDTIPEYYKPEHTKYPFAKVLYPGRPIMNHANIVPMFDVRTFLVERDYVFQEALKTFPVSYAGETEREVYDSVMLSVADQICRDVSYARDDKTYGFNEYWAMPQETWALRVDDCEGKTNLGISMAMNAGVPYYLMRNVCGITHNGYGHSTLDFFASDDTWRHLEMTRTKITEKSVLDLPLWNDSNDESNIKDIWFSTNSRYSYNKFTTMGARDSFYSKKHNFIII